MSEDHTVDRRDFVKAAVGAGLAMGALSARARRERAAWAPTTASIWE